jgi:hypothetical protein
MWTQAQALDLCRKIEAICPHYGCHVALTGGTLYKDGARKDCDILFYRIRQVEAIDVGGLMSKLPDIDVTPESTWEPDAWVIKGRWRGKPLDMFFPENKGDQEHISGWGHAMRPPESLAVPAGEDDVIF